MSTTTDVLGRTTSYGYDALNRQTATTVILAEMLAPCNHEMISVIRSFSVADPRVSGPLGALTGAEQPSHPPFSRRREEPDPGPFVDLQPNAR